MTEIKLTKRYPQSRTEDIVDAYMRGWNDALDAVQNGKFIINDDRKTEPTTEDCSTVDKDINVRSKDEPQTNADQHIQRVEYVGNDGRCRCWKCKHFEGMHETPISSDGSYYTYVVCSAKECNYEPKDEPQTCSVNGRPYDCGKCEYFRCTADEPQTERSSE